MAHNWPKIREPQEILHAFEPCASVAGIGRRMQMPGNRVGLTTHQEVALIQIDNPPVNALSPGIPAEIERALEVVEQDAGIRAIVMMGAGRTFVAGADITTLERAAWGTLDEAVDLHGLLARVEDCSKPVVMAIHGTAFGGGLELAMAGHYRIATPDALVGQPEVNLGIIPGAEGTQRLPRLIGIARALEMCVSGKPVKASDALADGLIDAIVEGDLRTAALDFARDIAERGSVRKTRERGEDLGTPDTNALLFASARELAARTRRQQIAPPKVVEAIEAAATLPFAEGCRRERELFFECVQSEQAKALIHLFFAERAAARPPDLLPDTPAAPVERVGILGAGTMGGGIAMACANAGLHVRLKDESREALARGLETIRRNYQTSVSRGRLTEAALDERLARIQPQLTYDGFEQADLVVEAVYESLGVKKRVFAELDRVARPGAILGTNTSTLDVDAIAAATSRPASVIGLHFFSPAHVMRLTEVVRGAATGADTLATAVGFARRIGKLPVVVGNCRGFVGNRMLFPYMYEAQFLVEEGATPAQVDRALTGFGMAMGPFAVDDMAGLDVAWRVRQELGHFSDPASRRPLIADRLYEMGRLGQKAGAGWYRYAGSRQPIPDPEVEDLIRTTAAAAGVPQRTFSDQEIVERLIFALVNEGFRVLEEGFARRALDIDVIYVNGYGFPAWRGGPLFYADRLGLRAVHDRLGQFQKEAPERWAPAPLLARLADSAQTLREYERTRVASRGLA
ncbi:MAG TPA: 3-hydroxyacyl-CoA dehydrogenase NAD-binding domain-containing protein [Vicinamibacterales bacterium]|nr:3-hydroxyacyl-CoA dehydrogenase NAD-binding domain-containing protein [Vicinamibacterales bacterium]